MKQFITKIRYSPHHTHINFNKFLLYRDSGAQAFPAQKFLKFGLNTEYLVQGHVQLNKVDRHNCEVWLSLYLIKFP